MSVWAFLDESGDPNLEIETLGSTTHFAVGAVVVPDAALHERRAAVEQVRRKHFQTGPIKSRSVGAKIARRLTVLQALRETGCLVLGLVVDKRRLRRDSGLQFRQSFMKYLNRFVYERLFRAYPTLRIRADRHGRPEFMESFEAYLAQHFGQTDFFSPAPEIEFVESDSEVLVQAADLVAGSLRIAYSDDTPEEDARSILASLKPVSIGIQEWPVVPRTLASLPDSHQAPGLDDLVRQVAERSAYVFLAQAQDKDDESTRMQFEVLQELLHASRFEDSRYLSADALAERMVERGYRDCTRDVVRRNVIAPMRDREVLIVSSARGYGLASKLADVETHIDRMEEEIRPILRRVQSMESQLKRMSVGRVDLLKSDRFRYLRGVLEQHELYERLAHAELTGGAA